MSGRHDGSKSSEIGGCLTMDAQEIIDPEAFQRPIFQIESVKPSGTAIDSKRGTLKPLMGSEAPKAGPATREDTG
jgi:hypothetical protein